MAFGVPRASFPAREGGQWPRGSAAPHSSGAATCISTTQLADGGHHDL